MKSIAVAQLIAILISSSLARNSDPFRLPDDSSDNFLMPWNRLGHHFSSSNWTGPHNQSSLERRVERAHSVSERERGLDGPRRGHDGPRRGVAGINWVPRINPSGCLMGRMCETGQNYPTEAIARLVQQQLTNLTSYLENDEREFEDENPPRMPDPPEKPLCDVKKDVKYFKVGKPVGETDFMFIVNAKSYRQRVPYELCTRPDGRCSYVDSFERPVCRQKYAQLGLLAINKEGELDVHTFTVPTTCVCHVRPISRKRRTTAMSKSTKGKGRGRGTRRPKKNQSTTQNWS